jgi:DNA-binding NarL/FixJ family response regulator
MATGDDEPLRIVLVEPREISRRGLHGMLDSLAVVASVQTLPDVAAAHRLGTLDLADVLLVSSDLSPREVRGLMEAASPDTRVLVVIRKDESATLAAAALLPAHGFVFEPGLDAATLNEALTQMKRGNAPMPAALAEHLLWAARNGTVGGGRPSLTPRERQVLGLMTRGMSNKAIARELEISEHGAKRHVGNVLAKLNAPNRTMAVARALHENLLN